MKRAEMRARGVSWLLRCLFVWLAVAVGAVEAQAEEGFRIHGEVLLNPEKLQFTAHPVPPLPSERGFLFPLVGDFDGDGDSDLLTRDPEGSVWLALNDGSGSFALHALPMLDSMARWIAHAAGDIRPGGGDEAFFYTFKGEWVLVSFEELLNPRQEPLKVPKIPVPERIMFGKRDCHVNGPALYSASHQRHKLLRFVEAEPNRWRRERRWNIYEFALLGRFRDRQCREPLLSNWAGYLWLLGHDERRTWAEFPAEHKWAAFGIGDFNGDGFDDLVISLVEPLPAWWVALSNGRTGLEQTIAGPPVPPERVPHLATGDFNGDGLDDLLVRHDLTHEFTVAFAVAGTPLSGVTVRLGGAKESVTDARGQFHFEGIPSGSYQVEAKGEGLQFLGPVTVAVKDRDTSARLIASKVKPNVVGEVEQYGPLPGPPYACSGYIPHQVSGFPKWGVTERCPAHWGFYFIGDPSSKSTSPGAVRTAGNCCALPSSDILTAEQVWVEGPECPQDMIVTGGEGIWHCNECPKKMRCTKINTARYQLGPMRGGRYWGVGHSIRSKPRYPRTQLPEAVRHAAGRNGYNGWDSDGCVGDPPGSLLVRRDTGGCSGLMFRELQYRGSAGDPPSGTPVQMFPECDKFEHLFHPTAGCLTSAEKRRPRNETVLP